MPAVVSGVPMEKALNPDECDRVRMFLSTLLKYHNQYKYISIMKFMNAYRMAVSGYRREFNHGFWTEQRVGEIKRMRANGVKWTDIEKHFGKSRSSVVEAYKRRGGYYDAL